MANLFAVAQQFFGAFDDGTPTNSPNIDSALVLGTSGDAWVLRFQALRGQTSATLSLNLYPGAVTGTPTFEMEIYNVAADLQRPGGAAISSASSSYSPTVSEWGELTCTVSLTLDTQYFAVVKNTSADPVNNHAAFRIRGALDSWSVFGSGFVALTFIDGSTADGFTTDPTLSAGGTACVLKYSDGTLQGNPYVTDDSAHANNANDRGIRLTPTEDLSVCGVITASLVGTTAIDELRVYTTAGASVVNIATTASSEANSMSGFCDPTTLSGGTAYDTIIGFSASNTAGTIYTMGEIEANVPADVLACRPLSCAYVDGATPGSYTVDTSKLFRDIGLMIESYPAISGGGGLRLAGAGGLAAG